MKFLRTAATIKSFFLMLSLFCLSPFVLAQGQDQDQIFSWFEEFKANSSKEELYRLLYAMPKGGDLHHHTSGSVRSERFYELAVEQMQRGYRYYTKVEINNCRDYGTNEYSDTPYLMYFINLLEVNWEALSDCEKSEYLPLDELNETQRQGWYDSMRLDQLHEGRDEFFQSHWQRMNDLYSNPYVTAEIVVQNMKDFSLEGLSYLEAQIGVRGFQKPDGSYFTPEETADIYRQRLSEPDAVATGMTVRFQLSLLRFTDNAEESLEFLYEFAHYNSDMWVAVNFVGREDNDKGHPSRFLETLRELRRQFHSVKLSIHAGEVDEPNYHVRDTLLLGADRIGHGNNLITDDDTMRLMRHGPYLVEINLISNLLLEYVDEYSQHPFPEYLRTGIPVALSTDDRGMWDSTMTDEFYVAVSEFNLSWTEIRQISRNSLYYAFVEEPLKTELLADFDSRMDAFERQLLRNADGVIEDVDTQPWSFICERYQICSL